jgi:hypothetical protein
MRSGYASVLRAADRVSSSHRLSRDLDKTRLTRLLLGKRPRFPFRVLCHFFVVKILEVG